ncbi:MAG: hypothetical protein K8R36_20495 [Planctomycetales bacterium]|nr:hypothetical protein [Planctomycetales bacterium]
MSQNPLAASHGTSQHKQCFECGAVLNFRDKSCWMCHAEQPLMGELIVPPAAKPPAHSNPWATKAAIWLGVIAAVIVMYGILRAGDYVLATLFLVAAVPTLVIVMLGSTIARASGKPWGTGTKVGVAAGTILSTVIACIVAVAVAVLVIFAMFIAMIQECFRTLGVH